MSPLGFVVVHDTSPDERHCASRSGGWALKSDFTNLLRHEVAWGHTH